MKIRRMTDAGRIVFEEFLDSLRSHNALQFPLHLLSDDNLAEAIGGDTRWLDELNLDDRLQAAKTLDQIVIDLELPSVERDWGFWTWCAAYLFDRLCKRRNDGNYKPGELSIWIAQPNDYKRYYRHYLASIWGVYSAHRHIESKLPVLLSGPVNTPGELWEQIASIQPLITNPSIVETVYHLFWDKGNGARKRGAGGHAPRRLTRVLGQFELTYDFHSMSCEQILRMLPSEFDRFKEHDALQSEDT